jgi:hypothetical protein
MYGVLKKLLSTARICSVHFEEKYFENKDWIEQNYGLQKRGKRLLKSIAIPTLHLPSALETNNNL